MRFSGGDHMVKANLYKVSIPMCEHNLKLDGGSFIGSSIPIQSGM